MKFAVVQKGTGKIVTVYDIKSVVNLKGYRIVSFLVYLDEEWKYVESSEFKEFK